MRDRSLNAYISFDSGLHFLDLFEVEILGSCQPSSHFDTGLHVYEEEDFLISLTDRLERLDQLFLFHLAEESIGLGLGLAAENAPELVGKSASVA